MTARYQRRSRASDAGPAAPRDGDLPEAREDEQEHAVEARPRRDPARRARDAPAWRGRDAAPRRRTGDAPASRRRRGAHGPLLRVFRRRPGVDRLHDLLHRRVLDGEVLEARASAQRRLDHRARPGSRRGPPRARCGAARARARRRPGGRASTRASAVVQRHALAADEAARAARRRAGRAAAARGGSRSRGRRRAPCRRCRATSSSTRAAVLRGSARARGRGSPPSRRRRGRSSARRGTGPRARGAGSPRPRSACARRATAGARASRAARPMPNASTSARAPRAVRRSAPARRRARGGRTCRRAGRWHQSWLRWPNTVPIRNPSALRSRHGTKPERRAASPDVGWRIPVSILIVVDFPAPLGRRTPRARRARSRTSPPRPPAPPACRAEQSAHGRRKPGVRSRTRNDFGEARPEWRWSCRCSQFSRCHGLVPQWPQKRKSPSGGCAGRAFVVHGALPATSGAPR